MSGKDFQMTDTNTIKLYEQCQKGFDICFADFDVKKQRLWKNLGSWINGKIAEVSAAAGRRGDQFKRKTGFCIVARYKNPEARSQKNSDVAPAAPALARRVRRVSLRHIKYFSIEPKVKTLF